MEKHYETCEVGWVEDHHDMFYVRAVSLHVLSEILGNLAVAFKEVLTCHTLLTWSAT